MIKTRQEIIEAIRQAVRDAHDLPDAEFEVTMREASTVITHAFGSRNDGNAQWAPPEQRNRPR